VSASAPLNAEDVESACRVCEADSLIPIYESTGELSFTSAQVPVPIKLRVAFCRSCGHAQTPPLKEIADYYDTGYNFRNRDPDEDDVYAAGSQGIVFRSNHQALVIEEKISLSGAVRILDYGSGKASSLRQLCERYPNVVPYAFDVSEAYRPAWDEFIPRMNQASYRIPEAWHSQLDVVLSLFSLEHVDDPREFVRAIRELLRPNGQLHLVVPHLYRNMSDLLVADHVNHFSVNSLRRLIQDAGFTDVRVDPDAHRAALVVNASRSDKQVSRPLIADDVAEVEREAIATAATWVASAAKVRDCELRFAGRRVAIYGSGVYGLFIASTLNALDRIAYFVDVNPFRQGLTLLGKPVISPGSIDDDVDLMLVGLNPRDAKQIIESSRLLHEVKREFVFL
jgi:SAM-dependent methyltransferase